MVTVVLEPSLDSLLRQTAADLDLTPSEAASIVLSSVLLLRLTT